MKTECPRCLSKEMKKVISQSDGSDNIDHITHYWLECAECGYNFNLWNATTEQLRKAFGDQYSTYK